MNVRWAAAIIAAALQACSTTAPSREKAGTDTEAHARTILVAKTAEAVRVQRDLYALLAEDAAHVSAKQAALDSDLVDVDYIGKPQALLDAIATRYRYRYVETGKRGDLAIIQVRVAQEPVKEVLRSIGHQVDAGADVILDQQARVLRLVYRPRS